MADINKMEWVSGEAPETAKRIDYDGQPYEILEQVEDQIRPFGLRVVLYDEGSSDFVWEIVPAPTPEAADE